jgi:2-polyprenyl-6-hydroxyphenyl methylase/3-demethylubiquinone-9 3-methyltransferase
MTSWLDARGIVTGRSGYSMKKRTQISGYRYSHAGLSTSHDVLLPAVLRNLEALPLEDCGRRLFELGCGNGSVANALTHRGWDVTGVDPSVEGIAQARAAYPDLKLANGSAYDDLADQFGQFTVVLSLEVVEHVYAPRHYARTVFDLLRSGGAALLSTPYHGYWKNLALALSGRMDKHFTALCDHGHIKFWSIRTMSELLWEAGFVDIRFERVGRIPALAKSMIAIARKP